MFGGESSTWSRRSLLGAGIATAATLIAGPALAQRRKPRRSLPDRTLFIQNQHTGEAFRGTFWENGKYLPGSFRDISRVMRDHRTGEAIAMDPKLIELLHKIQTRLDRRRPVFVTSGYRSLATNTALQEEGYHAADNSLHLVGKAADIRIERVRLIDMRRIAVAIRAGGVGTYGAGNFLHVDTGRVRFW